EGAIALANEARRTVRHEWIVHDADAWLDARQPADGAAQHGAQALRGCLRPAAARPDEQRQHAHRDDRKPAQAKRSHRSDSSRWSPDSAPRAPWHPSLQALVLDATRLGGILSHAAPVV